MIKNQTVNSDSHLFTLTKLAPSGQSNTVTVSFAPNQHSPATSAVHQSVFECILPHFNIDGLHFTPAFLLPCDQKFYKENMEFERIKFQERIQNAQEKHITHNHHAAAPPSTYCLICKCNFHDYYAHIVQPSHTQTAAASPANQLIQDLLKTVNHHNKKSKKINKKVKKYQQKHRELQLSKLSCDRWTRSQRGLALSRTISKINSASQILTVPE